MSLARSNNFSSSLRPCHSCGLTILSLVPGTGMTKPYTTLMILLLGSNDWFRKQAWYLSWAICITVWDFRWKDQGQVAFHTWMMKFEDVTLQLWPSLHHEVIGCLRTKRSLLRDGGRQTPVLTVWVFRCSYSGIQSWIYARTLASFSHKWVDASCVPVCVHSPRTQEW